MEQFFILLIFGAIALAKWYFDKAAGSSSDEPSQKPFKPTPPQTLRPSPEESEEERMRRFFEALGIPSTTTLPPKVAPPAQPAPKLQKKLPRRELPKPAKQEWSPTPAKKTTPPPLIPIPFPDAGPPEPALVPTSAEIPQQGPAKTPSPARSNIRARLQSPESIREAIILREILGPPRALQPYG